MGQLPHGGAQCKPLRFAIHDDESLLLQGVQQAIQRRTAQSSPSRQLSRTELPILRRESDEDLQRPVHSTDAFRRLLQFTGHCLCLSLLENPWRESPVPLCPRTGHGVLIWRNLSIQWSPRPPRGQVFRTRPGVAMNKETSELLTRTGSGSPMGNLMRRYWVPALLSSEIAEPDGP